MDREIERHTSVAACGRACLARVAMSGSDYQEFARPAEPVSMTGWTSADVGRFYYDGSLYPPTTQPNNTTGLTPILVGSAWVQTNAPILIDPIGYSLSAGTDFPAASTSEPRELLSDTDNANARPKVKFPRVTLRTWNASGTRQVMPQAMADRLFHWSDDVTIPVPKDDSRPRQVYQEDATGNPLVAQSDGAYSWAVMVQPADECLGFPARSQTKFRAWVLIYQRRDIGTTTPPVERTVVANVLDGTAGGDIKLTSSDPSHLAIKKDRWLMLVGVDNERRLRCEWYQVRTIDREATQETATRWAVNASLHGPDWPCPDTTKPTSPHWCDKVKDPSDSTGVKFLNTPFDLDGDGNARDCIAVIVDDLVGVHQGDGRYITMEPY